MSNWQFSANRHPEGLLDGLSQSDFIDGGILQFAAWRSRNSILAGNVNVSKFGSFNPGAGGFIDIAHNARNCCLPEPLQLRDCKLNGCAQRQLRISRERARSANSLTPPSRSPIPLNGVVHCGQRAKIITERAVFEVTAEGLVLTETFAKGVIK